jgi:hypothetical protein
MREENYGIKQQCYKVTKWFAIAKLKFFKGKLGG